MLKLSGVLQNTCVRNLSNSIKPTDLYIENRTYSNALFFYNIM